MMLFCVRKTHSIHKNEINRRGKKNNAVAKNSANTPRNTRSKYSNDQACLIFFFFCVKQNKHNTRNVVDLLK